jgi:hypothetical protein
MQLELTTFRGERRAFHQLATETLLKSLHNPVRLCHDFPNHFACRLDFLNKADSLSDKQAHRLDVAANRIEMRKCDEMDGQTPECESAAAFESIEPMESERYGWRDRADAG